MNEPLMGHEEQSMPGGKHRDMAEPLIDRMPSDIDDLARTLLKRAKSSWRSPRPKVARVD